MSKVKAAFSLVQQNLEKILTLRTDFTAKEDGSYVSKGDLFVQDLLFDFFKGTLTGHYIISEENDVELTPSLLAAGDFIFIDPIDGTENFVSGLREWGIGISIYSNGRHSESGIYLPELNQIIASGDKIDRFNSRIMGLSSSLNIEDLINLSHGYEYRIIGCSMYNMLSVVQGSFNSFENVKGVNCWDILPGLNLAMEFGLACYVDGLAYQGEPLFPTQKYRVLVKNNE